MKAIKQEKLRTGHWRADPNTPTVEKWNQFLIADSTEFYDDQVFNVAFELLARGTCDEDTLATLCDPAKGSSAGHRISITKP